VIDKSNVQSIEWEDKCFRIYTLKGFSIEFKVIDSDFITCNFDDTDWYSTTFAGSRFFDCELNNCIFRGVIFCGSRFVECTFANCQFLKDEQGMDCFFDDAIAYNCKFSNCVGFGAKIVNG